MIKVGIINFGDLPAAELLRVLINHPDIELKWIQSSRAVGTRLDALVPGIIGECDLTTVGEAQYDDIDLVFLCGSRSEVASLIPKLPVSGDVRVIDMSGCHILDCGEGNEWIYGLGEMQRRVLVHDAYRVTIPGCVATASLLALMPLARNSLLNSPLEIRAAVGQSIFIDDGKTLHGMTMADWAQDRQHEVAMALSQCQSSFNQPVDLTLAPLAERRTLSLAARLKCEADIGVITQLYEQYYDDHNFVFIVDRPIVIADVENTNKCLLYLDKDDCSGDLTVHAVMDVLLKGCAGNAVHAMNLMFGLHERVGLALKGTGL